MGILLFFGNSDQETFLQEASQECAPETEGPACADPRDTSSPTEGGAGSDG